MLDSWQDWARLGVAVAVAYGAVLWLSLVYWAYRDARSRTNDLVSQAVAVLLALVFNVLGLFIYLILRPKETLTEAYERSLEAEAILQDLEHTNVCPSCRRRVQDDFLLCPYCRTGLRDPCGQCSRPLSLGWVACPYCATERPRLQTAAFVPASATDPNQQPGPGAQISATAGSTPRPANTEPLS
jgi:hypothetical protein